MTSTVAGKPRASITDEIMDVFYEHGGKPPPSPTDSGYESHARNSTTVEYDEEKVHRFRSYEESWTNVFDQLQTTR